MSEYQPNAVVALAFEGSAVRVQDRDGNPWFVVNDVCRVLEIGNPRDAASRLDDDEKGVVTTDTPGGTQKVNVINESGLNALIMTSRKPEAKRFRKWVTATVLPTIRRTGSYGTTAAIDFSSNAALLALANDLTHAMLADREKMAVLTAQNEDLKPKAAALAQLADTDGTFCFRDAAKECGCGQNALIARLAKSRWIFKEDADGPWLAYADRIKSGHLVQKVSMVKGTNGKSRGRTQTRVTMKGLALIAKRLAAGGVA